MAKHGDVVSSIAKGHYFVNLQSEMADYLVDASLLGVAGSRDVGKGGIPTAYLAMG